MGHARLLPGAMIGRYRDPLGAPGGRGLLLAGFLGRLPMSMRTLGCLLLVSTITGSYTLAGAVSAVLGLCTAIGSVPLARWADRHGQRPVLLWGNAVQLGGIVGLVGAVSAGAPAWTYFPLAALAGLSVVPTGSLVRSRWAVLLGRSERIQAAYALEAVADEVIYILGPLVVVGLATGVAPQAGLLGAMLLAVTGALLLAGQRRGGAPLPRSPGPAPSVLRHRGLWVLCAVYAGTGVLLGAIDVGMIGFAARQGTPGAAGPLLALMTAASMLAGLAFGGFRWRISLPRRLALAGVVLAIGALPLPLAGSLPVMAGVVLLTGLGISPILIAGSALVESLIRADGLTEAFAVLASGVTLGMSAGSALGGALADASAGGAFLLATGCGILVAACCLAGARHLVPGAAPAVPTTAPSPTT